MKPRQTSQVATRLLCAVSPEGDCFDLHIHIDAPRPHATLDWVCKLHITQLFSPANDLYGVDSWQALQLALKMARTQLQNFIDRGGLLYWHGSADLVSVDDLF